MLVVPDDGGVVKEFVGNGGGSLIVVPATKQLCDVVDDVAVAHSTEDIGVVVGVLSTHAAEVERKVRPHRLEDRRPVVGDDYVCGGTDFKVFLECAGNRDGRSLPRATRCRCRP